MSFRPGTVHSAAAKLTELIDEEVDSLRFYYLGNKYQTKVDHVGVDHGLAADQVLIL